MYRRVVFALPALQLSGSIVAHGSDAAPRAKPLTGAPGTGMTGETAPRGNPQQRGAGAPTDMVWKELARTRW
jgi:hypothetical protein